MLLVPFRFFLAVEFWGSGSVNFYFIFSVAVWLI